MFRSPPRGWGHAAPPAQKCGRSFGLFFRWRGFNRIDQGAGADHALGIRRDLLHMRRAADSKANHQRQIRVAPDALQQVGQPRPDLLPRARHARQRHAIDKAARHRNHLLDPLVRRGWRDKADQIKAVRLACRMAFPRFFRRQVGNDHAVRASRRQIGAQALQAILIKWVEITHHDEGRLHARRAHLAHRVDAEWQIDAVVQCLVGRALHRCAVGQRVGKRHAKLKHVCAGRLKRAGQRHR
jgi:hypothetical protein